MPSEILWPVTHVPFLLTPAFVLQLQGHCSQGWTPQPEHQSSTHTHCTPNTICFPLVHPSAIRKRPMEVSLALLAENSEPWHLKHRVVTRGGTGRSPCPQNVSPHGKGFNQSKALLKPRVQDKDSPRLGLRWYQSCLISKGGSWPHLKLIRASWEHPGWLDLLLFQEEKKKLWNFLVVNSN